MSIATESNDLKIVRAADGLEIDLLPLQGLWSEEQYLKLSDHTNHLIEFTDGVIEVLPMPSERHQILVAWLFELLLLFVRPRGGKVLFAPLRLHIRPGKQREPDIMLLLQADDARRQNRFWLGADLVVEVVSPDDSQRDIVEKVADYAEAAIAEYWVVNPLDETVTVYTLVDDTYVTHGMFRRGDALSSPLLTDLAMSITDLFDAD
jgi:Uma2 family endonuclease